MRKSRNIEEIRRQIDAQFNPVMRGGEVFIQEIDEDGKPINYNKVTKRENYNG